MSQVTKRSVGAASMGTTPLSLAYPATISANDLLVCRVVNRDDSTGPPTTPSGWTLYDQRFGGSGSNATDDRGNVYVSTYYKVADGTETGNLSITIPSTNSSGGYIICFKSSVTGRDIVISAPAGGSQNSGVTTWDVTMDANVPYAAGDCLTAFAGYNGNLYGITSETLSATGVTLAAVAFEASTSGTSAGHHTRCYGVTGSVTSGTATAAAHMGVTANFAAVANSPAGACTLMGLRELQYASTTPPTVTWTAVDPTPAPGTRFYFPSSSTYAAGASPGYDAGWGSTSDAIRRQLVYAKKGETLTNAAGATLPNIAGVAAAGANALIRQYVSDPLQAQTISTSVLLSCQWMMRETDNANNIDAARIMVNVVSNDGSTVRGTLLSIGQYGTTANEFTSAAGCRNVKVVATGTACQNTVVVQAGDRLVIEIGGITSLGGALTPVVNCRVGDNATDLPIDDTQTTDGAAWFDFSQQILFAYSIAQPESITKPTDANTRAQGLARAQAESIAIPTDANTRAQVLVRGIAESITKATDANTRAGVFARAQAESIVIVTDAVTRALVMSRTVADSISAPTDAKTRALVLARVQAESIAIPTDANARAQVLSRSIGESIAIPTDADTRAQVLSRTISEADAAPTDSNIRALVISRTKTETLSAPTDADTRAQVLSRTASDVISAPTDTNTRAQILSISISDSISAPTDVDTRTLVIIRTEAESITIPTDTNTRAQILSRFIPDSISLPSDSISRSQVLTRVQAESESAPTDANTKASVFSRSLTDAIGAPVDSWLRNVGFYRTASEVCTQPSDVNARVAIFSRTVVESKSLSDAVTRACQAFRTISENVAKPTDVISGVRGQYRSMTETFAAPGDGVVRRAIYRRAMSENIHIPVAIFTSMELVAEPPRVAVPTFGTAVIVARAEELLHRAPGTQGGSVGQLEAPHSTGPGLETRLARKK